MVELRAELLPPGAYRLPGPSADGLLRRRGDVLLRLTHVDGQPLLLRAARRRDGAVVLGARTVGDAPPTDDPRRLAARALARWRHALAVDLDLRPFLRAHRDDPLIGASLRERPWLRPSQRPTAFEALLCAVCEQLIAFEDAVRIERRIVWRHGAALAVPELAVPGRGGARAQRAASLRDAPSAADVAARVTPAQLEACGLAPKRAAALHRAAREIAAGRIDAELGGDSERALLRLGRIPEIGSWTLALVAGQGFGRVDRPPSGDLNLVKAVGRMRTGDPRARATEADVDALLAPYAPWGALAAAHLMATRGDRLPSGRAAAALLAARPPLAPPPPRPRTVAPPRSVRTLEPGRAAATAATAAV
ncbi:hypothetical protein [Patulibacter defluvii]|uniref:hypothetical protein n=1 Tax=Patulibacter defluvii TaxID=3095358 RepID=UPI002A74C99D|nr:hypothetical protein [Patulibacter sp. DM4]